LLFAALIFAGGAVAAPNAASPGSAALASERWDEVLLLEALRYLRVSPAQLAQMAPLARRVEGRLSEVRAQSAERLARLERQARENREALLGGQRPSTKNETETLLLRRALEQQRAQAKEELVRSLVPTWG
jgi:hypothetical protein